MENEEVIDLWYLFKILKKHLLFIILVGLVCGAAAFVLSEFVMTKKYESKALLYVENWKLKGKVKNVFVNGKEKEIRQ